MFATEFNLNLPFNRKLQISFGKCLTWDYFILNFSATRDAIKGSTKPGINFSLEIFGLFIDFSLTKNK